MSDPPERVLLHEEAPREGFQSEQTFIPTKTKIASIEALANTGVREINCASFVNPKRVPQMGDSELVAAGLRCRDGVRYAGTWMNLQGFERALKSGLDLEAMIDCAALAESIVGHPLPSKVAKSGSLQSRRRGTVTTT